MRCIIKHENAWVACGIGIIAYIFSEKINLIRNDSNMRQGRDSNPKAREGHRFACCITNQLLELCKLKTGALPDSATLAQSYLQKYIFIILL